MKPDMLAEMQLGKLSRQGEFVPRARDAEGEDDRVRELSFASEEPYERWWGVEILDHSPGAGDLSRLNNAGPLLLYHDTRMPVGVIEKAWLDKESRRSRALVRFGRGAAASDALRDVDDGILSHVSFAYWPLKMRLQEEEKDKPPVYLVTKWQALEISLVTVAADDTVGVGRAAEDDIQITVPIERRGQMKDPQNTETKAAPTAPVPVQVDVKAEREAGAKIEQARTKGILAHCEVAKEVFTNARDLADTFISDGRSPQEYAESLRTLGTRKQSTGSPATLDLSAGERQRYDLLRAIRAYSSPKDQRAWDAAAFERECSDAVERRVGRSPSTFFVPNEVLGRTLSAGAADNGAKLVGTDHRGQDFVDVLRNRMLCTAMGAQIISGLEGNVSIPALTVGATGSWVAEGNAASETTQTIVQILLQPKTVTAWSEITDTLSKQSSPDAGDMVMRDLAAALAVSLDAAGLHGTAANNQPRGIAATSGIGSVPIGATGGAPTWSHIVKLEEEVAIDNADIGAVGYMTNPKVRRKLKETPVVASTDSRMVWTPSDSLPLNGYRCGVTNQVRSDLTKSSGTNLSAIFFGNWADLVFGIWGALDILVDPYSQSTTRKIRLVAGLTCDVAVRRAVSFAAVLDAATA